MWDVMGAILSGFGDIVGKLLGHPLDFLSGKACSTACVPTWDFLCYIENFCIPQLIKSAMVSILLYFVLLFLYLLYKLGICQCICHIVCRTIWGCFSTCFSGLDCCCTCLCYNLQRLLLTPRHNRRRSHQKDVEGGALVDISSNSSESQGSVKFDDTFKRRKSMREHRKEHMRKSLRPKNHRMQLQIVNDSIHHKKKFKNGPIDDHIRANRRTKFAQRGTFNGSTYPRRRT